jgi:serine/threonine-protein kinase
MGVAVAAHHLALDERVAIKLLLPELAGDREAVERFFREGRAAAKIRSEHVTRVLDVGALENGQPYLVMEYLEGEDLAQRLAREGRLPLPVVLHIARQIAGALTATHARGIVHRDLKPANIFLLAPEGSADFVKVVDFGISKMPRGADKLTRASTLVGTPEYMAPEQAKGRVDEIDHRTDQWAFAAILWEALGGRTAFAGNHADVSALLHRIVHERPTPLPASVAPAEVARVLERGLAKKQAERFATVNALMRALEEAVRPTSTGAAPVAMEEPRPRRTPPHVRFPALDPALVLSGFHSRPRRLGWWLVAVLVVVPLAAGAAVWGWKQAAPGEQPTATPAADARTAGPEGKRGADGPARRRPKRAAEGAP